METEVGIDDVAGVQEVLGYVLTHKGARQQMLQAFQSGDQDEVVADDGIPAADPGQTVIQHNRPWTGLVPLGPVAAGRAGSDGIRLAGSDVPCEAVDDGQYCDDQKQSPLKELIADPWGQAFLDVYIHSWFAGVCVVYSLLILV